MRLVTVIENGRTVAAVESPAGRHALLDARGTSYADVGELLRREPAWRAVAERPGRLLPADLPLARPVLSPGATVCVGLNYRRHVLEMKREMPTVPTLFSKLARSLCDPGARIVLPAASAAVDYEGELVAVIGRGGRDIPADRAWEAVAGLTLMNDVSMRDFQKRSLQWFAGKAWQASTPVGPAMVSVDALPELGQREIVTRVNGEERQRSKLADLIFDVPALVADLSRIVALEPGDLIATGTPGGVGDAMKPPAYLRPGDVVEIFVDGIGTLSNEFVGAE
jgi:acylpyruvate hydrolase